MSMKKRRSVRIMRTTHDLTVEDMCRMFETAGIDDVAREALRLMVADPDAARKVVAANPVPAALEGRLDLIDGKARTQATTVH